MYDFSFLVNNVILYKDSLLIKDGQFYKANCRTFQNDVELEFRDSLKMLNMPLSKLSSFLNLDIEKEVYDYSLNNVNIFYDEIISYDLIKDESLRQQIKQKCKKLGIEKSENTFDIIEFCDYYCERDIEVLKQAMEKFAEIIKENLNLDIFKFLTVSSLAQEYFITQGVYNDVLEIGGIVRQFI
jgi:hypothetical protein